MVHGGNKTGNTEDGCGTQLTCEVEKNAICMCEQGFVEERGIEDSVLGIERWNEGWVVAGVVVSSMLVKILVRVTLWRQRAVELQHGK